MSDREDRPERMTAGEVSPEAPPAPAPTPPGTAPPSFGQAGGGVTAEDDASTAPGEGNTGHARAPQTTAEATPVSDPTDAPTGIPLEGSAEVPPGGAAEVPEEESTEDAGTATPVDEGRLGGAAAAAVQAAEPVEVPATGPSGHRVATSRALSMDPGRLVAGPGVPPMDTRRAVPLDQRVAERFLTETQPEGIPTLRSAPAASYGESHDAPAEDAGGPITDEQITGPPYAEPQYTGPQYTAAENEEPRYTGPRYGERPYTDTVTGDPSPQRGLAEEPPAAPLYPQPEAQPGYMAWERPEPGAANPTVPLDRFQFSQPPWTAPDFREPPSNGFTTPSGAATSPLPAPPSEPALTPDAILPPGAADRPGTMMTPVPRPDVPPVPPSPPPAGAQRLLPPAGGGPRDNRRLLLLSGGALAAVALIAGGYFGFNAISSSDDTQSGGPTAAASVPASAQPTHKPSAKATKPHKPRGPAIDNEKTDPRPLSLSEVFPTTKVTLEGRTFRQDKTVVNHQCSLTARGAMARALVDGHCRSVVRATYIDGDKFAVTTGIAVMPTRSIAMRVRGAGDPSRYEWFRGMVGKHSPDIDQAGGYAASTVLGRYIIYSYTTYADGHQPKPGDKALQTVGRLFIQYTIRPIERRAQQ